MVREVDLSDFEKAIQEAFQSSIPLKPSAVFSVSKDLTRAKIKHFLEVAFSA